MSLCRLSGVELCALFGGLFEYGRTGQFRKGSFAPIGPGTVPVETVKVIPPNFGSFKYKRFYSAEGFPFPSFPSFEKLFLFMFAEEAGTTPRVKLPGDAIDSIVAASIIRIIGGYFLLLNRQVERILEIKVLPTVTKEVVEAARENLVIGQT